MNAGNDWALSPPKPITPLKQDIILPKLPSPIYTDSDSFQEYENLDIPQRELSMSSCSPQTDAHIQTESSPKQHRNDPFLTLRDDVQLDRSFDISDEATNVSNEPIEKSLSSNEPDPDFSLNFDDEERPTDYEIVKKGTTRGGDLLVSSNGYSYTKKARPTNKTVKWRCSVRGKNLSCNATVTEVDGIFTPGLHDHNHPAEPGLLQKIKTKVEIKEKARSDVFRSAASVVEDSMKKMTISTPAMTMKPENLERMANRHRQLTRPTEPINFDFDLDLDWIGDNFFRGDCRTSSSRHLLFATNVQLDYLKEAKRWFIDGTFRVVNKPFAQLLSVHSFLRKDENVKQVPLMFVLMGSRTKEDYKVVFEKINEVLGTPNVQNFVLDFEKATWLALEEIYPNVTMKGCVFHFTQALWRKIQELGLSKAYSEKTGIYKFCRKLLALPFLPPQKIPGAFDNLKSLANSDTLETLCSYIERTWMTSTTWSVASWSIYRRTVRTNNDVEGWHQRLNRKASKACLPMYLLISLLKGEGDLVEIQGALVGEGLYRRRHRSGYSQISQTLEDLWEKLDNGRVNTSTFLAECGKLYAPNIKSKSSTQDDGDD